MKRRALALIPLALAVSACAVGNPKPATYVTDISATLNGDAHSNIQGELRYWFRYGETTAYGTATPVRAIENEDSAAHPVSEPIRGLSPGTTYHWQMCVQDDEEDPPRDICSSDRTFTTGPAGGRSGIAFTRMMQNWQDVIVMDGDGGNLVNVTDTFATAEINPAFSSDGRRIAYSALSTGVQLRIFVALADGSDPVALTNSSSGGDYVPAWSPDGSKIAWTAYGGAAEIHVMDADGSDQVNLTNNPANDVLPDWSPDGSRIAFTSNRDGNDEIYVMNADGSNPIRLTTNAAQDFGQAWSPDGTKIAFGSSRDGDFEIYLMNADGSNPVPLTSNTAFDGNPDWSPDGSKIAFDSERDDPDDQQIYVMDADGGNPIRLTIHTKSDVGPRWSPRPEPGD